MITTSEGHYFPEPGDDCDCIDVRIWAEVVDDAFVALKVLSSEEARPTVATKVYLDRNDALNLASDLSSAVDRRQRLWASCRPVPVSLAVED